MNKIRVLCLFAGWSSHRRGHFFYAALDRGRRPSPPQRILPSPPQRASTSCAPPPPEGEGDGRGKGERVPREVRLGRRRGLQTRGGAGRPPPLGRPPRRPAWRRAPESAPHRGGSRTPACGPEGRAGTAGGPTPACRQAPRATATRRGAERRNRRPRGPPIAMERSTANSPRSAEARRGQSDGRRGRRAQREAPQWPPLPTVERRTSRSLLRRGSASRGPQARGAERSGAVPRRPSTSCASPPTGGDGRGGHKKRAPRPKPGRPRLTCVNPLQVLS